MRTIFSKHLPLLLVGFALLFASGCADAVFSEADIASATPETETFVRTEAPVSGKSPKLRHPQLIFSAQGDRAGKDGGDVNLFIAFNQYEADGITPRVLDKYGITTRILEEYGITRRILEDYGITNRVLEEYGITSRVLEEYGITNRVLEDYGITKRVLEEYGNEITEALLAAYGITPRMLEDFGITNRVLEDYNITARVMEDYGITARLLEEYARDFQRSLRLKVRVDKAFPGISIRISSDYLDTFLQEIGTDPDIFFIEPDASFSGGPVVLREGLKHEDQALPWNIARVGAAFTEFGDEDVHVFVLDSGVFDEDLNVIEQKDFTMLFVNRDQATWDDTEYQDMPVFDPGERGNPLDRSGHGTHVAGTIGAENNNKGVKGMAPGANIHSLKVLTDEGRTDITTVIAAIDYVTDWKQRNPLTPVVMNMSLGMDLESTAYNVLDEAVANAIDFGVTVVVSAGNDGRDAATYSPAHVTEAITVGAYDQSDLFADFSNYGSVVDLLAPGEQVVSLSHLEEDLDAGDNILMNGTSHAAPHVAAAAALYLSHNPQASPTEVKQALVNYAQSGILNVPDGTTDKTVYVGDFAADGATKPFAVHVARWSSDHKELKVEGEGPRLDTVTLLRASTGVELTTLTIGEDGKWVYRSTDPAIVPCAVTIRYNGSQQAASESFTNVEFAPGSCEDVFHFTKAEWKDNDDQLKFEGRGPFGYEVAFTDASTGEAITTMTIGNDGKFNFDEKDLAIAPCNVRATYGDGQTTDAIVTNPPSHCADQDLPVVITKAEYDKEKDKIKIEGDGTSGTIVTAIAPVSGTVIGTDEVGGSFKIEVTNPAVLPCTVRVEASNGFEAEYPVIDRSSGNAPSKCERSLVMETVEWSNSHQELELIGQGRHNGTVTFASARTGAIFHTAQLDDEGKFNDKVGNLTAIPCAVIIEAEEAELITMQMPVESAAYNCDVDLTFTTLRYLNPPNVLSVGGSATADSDVTLVNPDNGATLTTFQASTTGTWGADLSLTESGSRPPCRIEARAENGDVISNTVSTASCDPNFTYTPVQEDIEQNAHSFVRVTKAQWNYDARTLHLEGEGYVLYDVTLTNARTGTVLGGTTVDAGEAWTLDVVDPDVVPCAVRATLDGRMADLTVSGVTTCDEIPLVTKALWKDNVLTVLADGPYSANVAVQSTTQGTIYDAAFDANGKLNLALTSSDLPFVPCTLRLDVAGESHDMAVDGAPASCDGAPFLSDVTWDRGKVLVTGSGAFGGSPVTLRSQGMNEDLFTTTFNADGTLELQLDTKDLLYAPCTLEVVGYDGRTTSMEVDGAPASCDGAPFLSDVTWDNGKLVVLGSGAFGGSPVTLRSLGMNEEIHATTFKDDGTLDLNLDARDLPYAPCTLEIVGYDGRTATMAVDKAPASCDGAPFLSDVTWNNGNLIVIGSGALGESPVTLRSQGMDEDLFATTFDKDGTLEVELDMQDLPYAPCTLEVVGHDGRTTSMAVDKAPESCDGAPVLSLAKWDKGKLLVEGEGAFDSTVTLGSAATGALVYTTTFEDDGLLDLRIRDKDMPFVPCTLRLTGYDGRTTDLAVKDAPGSCQ